MLNIQEKMFAAPFSDVRDGFIARARLESGRIADARLWMVNRGFEEVEQEPGQIITPDGREILRAYGKAWALRPEVHVQRMAEVFEAAKKRQDEKQPEAGTKSVVGTESLSSMVCPKCGDSLQHTAVCPKCAAGQRGYKHRYACVCGAIEIISQEAL